MKNPAAFTLPDNHPLRVAQVQAAKGGTVPEVVLPPPGPGSICGSVGGASWISKDVLETRLTTMERNSTDANAASLCSIFRELLKD